MKTILPILLLTFFALSAPIAFAQDCRTDPNDPRCNSGTPQDPGVNIDPAANPNVVMFDPIDKSIEEIFLAILDIIMVFAVPIVLFFIVWAGFLYVTARGDTTQLEKAHKALLYAVIGGVIVLGAQALLYVITNTIKLFG